MSTTAVFVELLIIGLESLLWLSLFISSLFGLDWVTTIVGTFEKADVFAAIVFIGLAYVVGIVVDEICDSLIEPWAKRIRDSVQSDTKLNMWDVQAYVFSHSELATSQLGYMRSRLRILRSSIFNIALVVVFAIAFLWTHAGGTVDLKGGLTWFMSFVGLLSVGCVLFVYRRITVSYWLRTLRVYKSLKREEKAPVPDK
jgi:hypothetical protein